MLQVPIEITLQVTCPFVVPFNQASQVQLTQHSQLTWLLAHSCIVAAIYACFDEDAEKPAIQSFTLERLWPSRPQKSGNGCVDSLLHCQGLRTCTRHLSTNGMHNACGTAARESCTVKGLSLTFAC